MNIISNTTVLSNFAATQSIGKLRDLFGEVFLSTEVYQEIQRGLEEGYSFYSGIEDVVHPFSPDGWLRLTSLSGESELLEFSGLPAELHAGEASCLAIARSRGWLFLTDDKAARRQAARKGVAVREPSVASCWESSEPSGPWRRQTHCLPGSWPLASTRPCRISPL